MFVLHTCFGPALIFTQLLSRMFNFLVSFVFHHLGSQLRIADPSLTRLMIPLTLFTNVLLSLLTASVWLQLVFAMAEHFVDRLAIGTPSEVHTRILEEVQAISCATLFAPVMRSEAVQAMSTWIVSIRRSFGKNNSTVLVAGWSDNGWLSGGHAVRMAMELSMHKAWPRLLRRMKAHKVDPAEDRELVIAARAWFCLYLFEHQLSYGTGRPAVLKEDETIQECRMLLQHPLAIEDDMRLVSTVELMAIRERVHNAMSPIEGPVREEHFARLREADGEFNNWFKIWDHAFSQKYEDAGLKHA
ncbi:hypothetical protein C0992_003618 [Termitomyces sp. T32_za158]|nr:hypothetical protein C0992_003618 [Termitomyces sp. T32_za158]